MYPRYYISLRAASTVYISYVLCVKSAIVPRLTINWIGMEWNFQTAKGLSINKKSIDFSLILMVCCSIYLPNSVRFLIYFKLVSSSHSLQTSNVHPVFVHNYLMYISFRSKFRCAKQNFDQNEPLFVKIYQTIPELQYFLLIFQQKF